MQPKIFIWLKQRLSKLLFSLFLKVEGKTEEQYWNLIREYMIDELETESERFTVHSDIERQDDKWIPVSERLPECEKDVLVFWGKASDGSKIDWFGTAWRNECDDGKWCTDPIVPTHWMPLPEPPIVYGKESEE